MYSCVVAEVVSFHICESLPNKEPLLSFRPPEVDKEPGDPVAELGCLRVLPRGH